MNAAARWAIGRPRDDGAPNNLALLRFLAASAVLFAHSWPISSGPTALDPVTVTLLAWFGDGVQLASMAVHAFFVISGYLVTQSALSRGGVGAFALARGLRIYPALIVNVLICACVIGALVTTLPAPAYFADPQFWKFTVNNVFSWNVIYGLPGVFADNPLHAVNGSLWTLPLEIRCYVAVGLMLALGVLKRGWLFTPLALLLVVGDGLWRAEGFLGADAAAACYAFFLVGAVLCVNRRWTPPSPLAALLLLGAASVTPVEPAQRLLAILGFALLVLWLGLAAPRAPWPEKRLGDPSYGIYIYAFPIQQLVVAWRGPGDPWTVVAIAGAATFVAAVASWKLVEAPMLALKSRRSPQPEQPRGAAVAQTTGIDP